MKKGNVFFIGILGLFSSDVFCAIFRDHGGVIKGKNTQINTEFRGEGTRICGTVTFFAAATLNNVKAKDVFAFDRINVQGSSCGDVVISGVESNFDDSHVARITVAKGDGSDPDDERVLVLKGNTVVDDLELESSITLKVEGDGVKIGKTVVKAGIFDLEAGEIFP